jgi:hypothetical protein
MKVTNEFSANESIISSESGIAFILKPPFELLKIALTFQSAFLFSFKSLPKFSMFD